MTSEKSANPETRNTNDLLRTDQRRDLPVRDAGVHTERDDRCVKIVQVNDMHHAANTWSMTTSRNVH
jgi:hypothetical protein